MRRQRGVAQSDLSLPNRMSGRNEVRTKFFPYRSPGRGVKNYGGLRFIIACGILGDLDKRQYGRVCCLHAVSRAGAQSRSTLPTELGLSDGRPESTDCVEKLDFPYRSQF